MKRSNSRARELRLEITVGTFMFAALLSLVFFTIVLSRENIFKPNYPFQVVFDDVMGLRDGDNVVIHGVTIGKVKKLVLQDDGVHVIASLRRTVIMRRDYRVEIVLSSVLGGRYMQIHVGDPQSEELPQGQVLRGVNPHNLIAEAAIVVANLKDITGRIKQGQGTLGKMIADDTLYNDARDIVGDLKIALRDNGMLTNLQTSVANLSEISTKINSGEGTLGKLVNDPELYDDAREVVGEIKLAIKDRKLLENLESTAANLKEISAKINSGEGTIGKLINDDSLYKDARRVINNLEASIDDYRETSPIVTFSSIFFGVF